MWIYMSIPSSLYLYLAVSQNHTGGVAETMHEDCSCETLRGVQLEQKMC